MNASGSTASGETAGDDTASGETAEDDTAANEAEAGLALGSLNMASLDCPVTETHSFHHPTVKDKRHAVVQQFFLFNCIISTLIWIPLDLGFRSTLDSARR